MDITDMFMICGVITGIGLAIYCILSLSSESCKYRRKCAAYSNNDYTCEQAPDEYNYRCFRRKEPPRKLNKSKTQFFGALTTMLGFYESYRQSLKLNREAAIKQTLQSYDDFYEWLQEEKR